jgi:hypothetical protein
MSDIKVNTTDKINKKVRRKTILEEKTTEPVPMTNEEQKAFSGFFKEQRERKNLLYVIAGAAALIFVITTLFIVTMINMKSDYIKSQRDIILSKELVKAANDWERLPEKEQKEKLRERFNEIIKYYTLNTKTEEKINDSNVILDMFNVVYGTTKETGVNFFLPIAYMKVITNFNPNFIKENKIGIASFFLKEAENVSNLPIMKNSLFTVNFKGADSLKNPLDASKLLVAKIQDLNEVFGGRTEWIIFALLTNEYEVIDRYWDNGKGEIPEDKIRSGDLKKVLDYYYAFKNWQVIPVE